MPRIARKNIGTPFIHVMVQGVNKEFIFDKKLYLNYYLKRIKIEAKNNSFKLIAYCMMNNHAHFLYYVLNMKNFEKFMKELNQNFATFYNRNEERVGVVFRNRYHIEQIFDINHIKNCIKYIHNNPVKSGMVKHPKEYTYSSYQDYLYGQGCAKNDILDDVFGKGVDYLKEIEDAYDRRFFDYDNIQEINDYMDAGIRNYIVNGKGSLADILCNRRALLDLIRYLKDECNLSYKESLDYLKIPKGILREL